ncbi:ubiquitin carboxyl-terminal hydrolase 30-like isoform X2 [Gigantopelta aegis]|uniref:ubiquitin carboxyl-terminal hydrolase 30-like isoform X2 n=1 Tax=Gigantopelta aegis TaxID=1735272 RepID=UPI001B888058|nr:ubiquitin carboxyl-terminal hydrolase 30-like isoform X2 [Gigantopelta aegis]
MVWPSTVFPKQFALIGGAAAAICAGVYVFFGPSDKERSKRKVCPGLENLGNTCFLNVVLQSLAACPAVVIWLGKFLSQGAALSGTAAQDYLAATIYKVLKVLNNNSEDVCDPYSPVAVITALRSRRWVISSEEQDAHELFQVLTQTLDEETSRYPSVVSLFDVKALQNPLNRYQPDGMAFTRSGSLLPILPQRDMEHPFRGLLASQLDCQHCGFHYPVKYDLFDSLSLSLPKGFWGSLSIDQLLRQFICPEIIESVICPECAKKNPCKKTQDAPSSVFRKKLTLGKLPQCLCLHIQRTQWINNSVPVKRYDYISFPEVLSMDEYVYTKNSRKDVDNRHGLFGGKDTTLDLLRFGTSTGRVVGTSAPMNLLRTLHHDSHTISGLSLRHELTTSHGDVNHNGPVVKARAEFTYKLASVIAHIGDEFSGHFVAYRRTPSLRDGKLGDKWMYTSDATVRKVSREEVLGSEAYMLFYERV